MLTTVDGVAKGSARSIANFNIYEALEKCKDVLIHFGGHKAAAGLAVEIDKIDEFKERFGQVVRESMTLEDLFPEIHIDSPLNMRPIFLSEGVEIAGNPRIIGNNHLLTSLKQTGSDKVFDAIGFNMGEYYDLIKGNHHQINIVYTIDKTVRDGRTFPQLRFKDLRVKEN
jgi:single-stranded-DNA-specific exonuclease